MALAGPPGPPSPAAESAPSNEPGIMGIMTVSASAGDIANSPMAAADNSSLAFMTSSPDANGAGLRTSELTALFRPHLLQPLR